jgi:peptidoglycan/LPS O-acetylase OafA/YrhL
LNQARRLEFVDALRGLALLGVVLVHTGQRVPELSPRTAAVTGYGAFGVHLFFVVSAFTLFLSLKQRSRSEARPTLNYFLRRLFRIAPMFWLAVPFYLVWNGTGSQYWAPHGITRMDVLATAAFVNGWSPTTINSVVPGGWSIAVEMNFYLLVPFLFTWLTNLRRCLWFFIGCVAGQWVINVAMHPVFLRHLALDEQHLADLMRTLWLPTQLPVFAAGFALYYALAPHLARAQGDTDQPSRDDRPSVGLRILTGVAVLALLPLAPSSTFAGTMFALLAAGLALRPSPLLVNAGMRYVGDISYSGYLAHFAVLDVADRGLRHFGAVPGLPVMHLTLLYATALLGTIVVATATTRLIEDPARRLGRLLIARLERKAAAPSRPWGWGLRDTSSVGPSA